MFLASGIASAIPATLVLFFIADVLQEEAKQGWFLALYFVAGAAGMPLWLRLSAQRGKPFAWSIAMGVAIVSFVWAGFLHASDGMAFAVVCALSGFALGADLALPPLLADDVGRREATAKAGACFGVWTLVTKLNLALAAGIALPLLAALDYVPGTRNVRGLTALSVIHAVVPCAFKLIALAALAVFDRSYRRIV